MESFDYVAVGPSGETVTGVLAAESVAVLDRLLEGKGLVLTQARPSSGARRQANQRLNHQELIALTMQLSTMVGAGVPLIEALESIGPRLQTEAGRAVVGRMVKELRGGASLSQVMDALPGTFPPVYRASIVAGEASGALDEILARLAAHLEWTRSIRATTLQALIYPFCLFLAIIGLVLILLLFVLPRIVSIFPGGTENLPELTRALIGVADFLRSYWLPLAAGVAAAAVGLGLARRSPQGRLALGGLLLRIPKLGGILRGIATSKFANTAATLHRAGCDIFTVIETSAQASGNARTVHEFSGVGERVRRGDSFSEALSAIEQADPLLVQLVVVGEKTGRLDDCLERIASYLDEEIQRQVKRFLAFLEPAMLAGAGVIVGFVLLATILPIFKMYETL